MASATSLIADAISNYVAAWNERDGDRRASLLERAVSDDVHLAIGGREIVGRTALESEIAAFHQVMPDARGRLSAAIDIQENVCRFVAVVERQDGSIVAKMLDACVCDATGRLRIIVTFNEAQAPGQ